MELKLQRLDKGSESTLGGLYIVEGLMSWLECFTCEDEPRVHKIKGQTRIPAGRYEIKLRPEGGMHGKYTKRFPYHKGMLWLQNVDNFDWVYIHVGNTHEDTQGCILVGATPMHDYLNGGGTVLKSNTAYERLYLKIIDALDHGSSVHLTVKDEL
tara:strand:+ start:34114 stop:34578 length:465 start_codon:yes stop_codon:yes gene_type:complete